MSALSVPHTNCRLAQKADFRNQEINANAIESMGEVGINLEAQVLDSVCGGSQ